MRVDGEVEVVPVVGNVDLCDLGGRRAIERLALHQCIDPRSLPPDDVVEPAINERRCRRARRAHAGPTGEDSSIACHGLVAHGLTKLAYHHAAGHILRIRGRRGRPRLASLGRGLG